MTKVDLPSIRQALETKRKELEGNRSGREEILIERTADELERIQQTIHREVAIRNIDRECSLLKEVVAAIERVSNGAYGACLYCEEPISANRLRVVPWAGCCIVCQEYLDRTRHEDYNSMDALALTND